MTAPVFDPKRFQQRDDGAIVRISDGRPICGARRSNGAGICTCVAILQNGRCRVHGGATPAGVASPHYRHGRRQRWRRALAGQRALLERYEEALADEQRLELANEIALTDAMISLAIERLSTGESGSLWADLVAAREEFRRAQRLKREAKRRAAITAAVEVILELIDRGASVAAARAELVELIDHRRKLTESERKRELDMHAALNTDQALELLGAIVAVVREEVKDHASVARISERVGLIAIGRQPVH